MKVNKLIKFFIVSFSIILVLSLFFSNYTYATTPEWQKANQFDSYKNDNLNTSVKKVIGAILNVTRIIGTGVALIMIIVVAMKYMMAAPGERADIKKHAIPFVIGAVILFGSSGILTIIQKFALSI